MKYLPFVLFAILFTASCKPKTCDSCTVQIVNTSSDKIALVELDDAFVNFVGPLDTLDIPINDSDKHTVHCSEDQFLSPDDVYREVQCPGGCEDTRLYFPK